MLLTQIIALILSVGPQVLIPAPASYEVSEGCFTLREDAAYSIYPSGNGSEYISEFEKYVSECPLRLVKGKKPSDSDIRIFIGDKRFSSLIDKKNIPGFSKKASYRIEIGKKSVIITSLSTEGAFYAIQDLIQMTYVSRELQHCTIMNYPRYEYRGLMIDLSRNFSSLDFIFKQIDMMALLHMSVLHLHLTDDAGWRIQIDKYPRLAKFAGWRFGRTYRDWVKNLSYAEEGTKGASGGYLSKEDAKAIIRYAGERHIEVIPEIEIPGHSREVLAAYPEIACRTDRNDVRTAMISSSVCPSNEKTYELFEAAMAEVMELFPSQYIHIGGDEANKDSWKKCEVCKDFMKERGIDKVEDLQDYCIDRIDKFVESKGKKIIGWDEILHSRLSKGATIMAWNGVKYASEALESGHDVIMTPKFNCYLDYGQDPLYKEPLCHGNYLPLEKVYELNPGEYEGTNEYHGNILGVQGNLWREYLDTDSKSEYMMYPRLYAIAEVAWTPQEKRSYPEFRERANAFRKIMAGKGYDSFDMDGEIFDRPEALNPIKHLAVGKKVKYLINPHKARSGKGETTMTDGKGGTSSFRTDTWLGFWHSDIDLIVDLEQPTDIHYIGATFMSELLQKISLPEYVEFYVSDNGTDFRKVARVPSQVNVAEEHQMFIPFGSIVNERTRYVRMFAKWRRNTWRNDWLFTDELVIN